jgi:23S rRNA (pseudouridine1915-N3)-methyltransferase
MKLIVLTAHASNPSWCDQALSEYSQKISFFSQFEIQKVKTKKIERDSSDLKRAADSKALLGEIEPADFVILLDEKGKIFDSIQFAKKIQQIIDQSAKRIIFVIGGPYGVDETLKKRAQLTVSMSAMTMNHWVAQLALIEQIYRAFTIMKGLPYHNI